MSYCKEPPKGCRPMPFLASGQRVAYKAICLLHNSCLGWRGAVCRATAHPRLTSPTHPSCPTASATVSVPEPETQASRAGGGRREAPKVPRWAGNDRLWVRSLKFRRWANNGDVNNGDFDYSDGIYCFQHSFFWKQKNRHNRKTPKYSILTSLVQEVNVKLKWKKSELKKKIKFQLGTTLIPKLLFGEKFWNTLYLYNYKLKYRNLVTFPTKKNPVPDYNLTLAPLPSAQIKSFAELLRLQWH